MYRKAVLKDPAPLGERGAAGKTGRISELNIAHSLQKSNLPLAIGYIVTPPERVRFSGGYWKYLDLHFGIPRALVKCPYCHKWHIHGAPDKERPGITRVSHCAPGGGEYRLVLIGPYDGQVLPGRYG